MCFKTTLATFIVTHLDDTLSNKRKQLLTLRSFEFLLCSLRVF